MGRPTGQSWPTLVPLEITAAQQTGSIENPSLNEISGLAVSVRTPGVLFALNDGGNPAALYALSETGADLGHWQIDADNRDWEDMASLHLGGKAYLVIGDTGNNLRRNRESLLHLIEEPSLDTPRDKPLKTAATIRYRYEDGPRNVEAFAISGNTVFLISKEPVGPGGPRPSRLYTLNLPDSLTSSLTDSQASSRGLDNSSSSRNQTDTLTARFAGELPLARINLEARLAAAVAGVDLNHFTALEFDAASNTAYLLTYRHVLRVEKSGNQTWVQALLNQAKRIHTHNLKQAEALAIAPGRSVWISSEHDAAPLWALPLGPPS